MDVQRESGGGKRNGKQWKTRKLYKAAKARAIGKFVNNISTQRDETGMEKKMKEN